MARQPGARAARQRWATASELLRIVHVSPGITRTQASRQLGISSGTATALIDRLRAARLLDETPAPASGRGRPTTELHAHAQGPLVIVVELSSVRWRVHVADLTGSLTPLEEGALGEASPAEVLARIAGVVATAEARFAGRVRAVSVVAAGLVSGTRLVQFTIRGWRDLDLAPIITGLPPDIELVVGNDATLGGVAEARTGAARSARVTLYLLIDVGLGGALLVDGVPMTGARGAAGEFGHVPYGGGSLPCPCGASGCWDLCIDGRALARHLGEPTPADPLAFAQALLAGPLDAMARSAAERVAHDLGVGIAGLVNTHDPDVVALAGLGPLLREAAPEAFDAAYRGGLMAFHRASPPEVVDGAYRDDGPLRGAVAVAVDAVTRPEKLEAWASLG